jgi:exopolysaccharide biosynthesis WecB/TagA/CpsF family protein
MSKKILSKIKILNVEIDNISSIDLLRKIKHGGILLTPNVAHLMILRKDRIFQNIYAQADYVVCDSKILCWAAKFLGQKVEEKISGSDFFPQFYQYYKNDKKIKIFLLGGTKETVEIAKNNINQKIGRAIVVGTYSPPFGFEKSQLESEKIVNLINDSGATVLAIGVGAPKQEKWLYNYKSNLHKVKIFLAIGATINFEAKAEKRAPKWVSEIGLEWFYRMIHNPRRLWKRYLVDSLPFFGLIFLQKFNLYKYKTLNDSASPKLDLVELKTRK